MDPAAGDSTAQVRRFHKRSVELRRELGKGQFGKVYKACIREPNLPRNVAIKIIWPVFQNGQQESVDLTEFRKQAYSELYKMSMLKHENIVKLLGMVESEIPWFVCEYMKDGNLLESLRKKSDLKDKDMFKFCHQIATGMEYLHANKILHKDLAARNILLDGKTIKIADMGLSSITSERSGGVYSINGKPFAFRQAARECIVEQIYTFETDIWAFGVLMYEIWSHGSVPYGQNSTESDVRRLIVDGKNPLSVRKIQCPPIIMSLMINQIFLINWTVRPSFHELKRFFYGILKKRDMHIPVPAASSSAQSQQAENVPPQEYALQQQQQQHRNRSPISRNSPQIIEPESQFPEMQEEAKIPRIRSNSNSAQRPPTGQHRRFAPGQTHAHGLLAASDHGNFSSASNPDLTRPVQVPQDFVPSLPSQYDLLRRRGSQDPPRGGASASGGGHSTASTPPLSSSPSSGGALGGNPSWLFPAGREQHSQTARKSLTPMSSLDLPQENGGGMYGVDMTSSTASLYPEFIPGRFHRDRRRGLGASQELLH